MNYVKHLHNNNNNNGLDVLKEVFWWGHITIIPQIYEILP